MIYAEHIKRKATCALCEEEMPRYTLAMIDPKKSAAKRRVHLTCWEELQRKRGIKLKEPPF